MAKQEATAEVKALAEEFSQTAQKTVEPKPQDVINAAKNYFVAKRIMAAENCQGISLNCLDLVQTRRIPCPPCMAWLTLNDEGQRRLLRVRLERGDFVAAVFVAGRPAGLHARPRGEHGQRHPDGRRIARRPRSSAASTSLPCR